MENLDVFRRTNLQNIQLVLFLFHIAIIFSHPVFHFVFQYLQKIILKLHINLYEPQEHPPKLPDKPRDFR